ncbi:hypothetical protein AF6_1602 [Anoxybacillus flavithermus TNO-09.006]|uniref:Uncharacterized protein n=1 Tax=Anoxybacillus flavithermus TaxID=33934 RepID=A0A178TJA9_9BACL|nr:hypothetical protein AF6_1602 [Anoxybacillus flavithermus TNO-09.006]OAO81515.1 hypothetical protein TAF16_0637 [Anoxybacillus flavithermus]
MTKQIGFLFGSRFVFGERMILNGGEYNKGVHFIYRKG